MPWCGSLLCAADACAAAVQGSQCCAHTVTVPCSTMAAGVLAMVPARTLKRMLGRSVVGGGCLMLSTVQCWGLMRWIGCTLTVRTGCLECLNGLACLTACLSLCLCLSVWPVACLVWAESGRDQLSTLAVQSRDEIKCHFRVGRLNPAKQALVNRSVLGEGGLERRHSARSTQACWQAGEPGTRQEPGARNQELDPLGVDGGQMRGRSCCVAHESKQLPCAGTRQRAVPIKGVCGN